MADGDAGEAQLAGHAGDKSLMLGIAIGVHEDDGDRVDARRPRLDQRATRGREVGRLLDDAIGSHALVDLDNIGVELFWLDDLLRENLLARLIANFQRVAETLRGKKDGLFALALQKRVGGDGGAHLHRADAPGGNGLARREAEKIADALHRRVAIGAGVLGEQLAGMQMAAGIAPDDVGEGAATIDPEVPKPPVSPRVRHD